MLRILAVVACIVAIIFFALSTGTTPGHDVAWGLVALSAGVGLLALEGVSLPRSGPPA